MTVTLADCLADWPSPPQPQDVIAVFEVPGRGQVKERPRTSPAEVEKIGGQRVTTKRAHTYTPSKTVAFEGEVGARAMAAGARRAMAAAGTRCGVLILRDHKATQAPEKRSNQYGDLDNYLKAFLDGMNHVAYEDDWQVDALPVQNLWGRGQDRTRIVVYRLPA